eukprot:g21883.t1
MERALAPPGTRELCAKAGVLSLCVFCSTVHPAQQASPRASLEPFVCECSQAGCRTALPDALSPQAEQQVRDRSLAAAMNLVQRTYGSSMQGMAARIQSCLQTVNIYERKALQDQALAVIPVPRLNQEAKEAYFKAREEGKISPPPADGHPPLGFRDFLMIRLLNWFKCDFFKWAGKFQCERCQGDTVSAGVTGPTPTEAAHQTSRTELYRCQSAACSHLTRFPRYNDPGKLLQTRLGRCGEWANCFTLCCRAMRFEVRVVHDWTDHVWTEYYSVAQKRWVHLDSCENTRDRPLTYEGGWGKKLNYTIAVGAHEGARDVIHRYTRKWDEVQTQRTLAPEDWLQQFLKRTQTACLSQLPAKQQAIQLQRHADEDRELKKFQQEAQARKLVEEEEKGRVSGDVEWKQSRGETGKSSASGVPPAPVLRPVNIEQPVTRCFRLPGRSELSGHVTRQGTSTTTHGGKHGDTETFQPLSFLDRAAQAARQQLSSGQATPAGPAAPDLCIRVSQITIWGSATSMVKALRVHYQFFTDTDHRKGLELAQLFGSADVPTNPSIASQVLQLDGDEWATVVEGRAGALVDALRLVTNKGKTVQVGNWAGGQPFRLTASSDQALLSFHGGFGGDLHNVGCHFLPVSGGPAIQNSPSKESSSSAASAPARPSPAGPTGPSPAPPARANTNAEKWRTDLAKMPRQARADCFKVLLARLTTGCGRPAGSCANPHCQASGANFRHRSVSSRSKLVEVAVELLWTEWSNVAAYPATGTAAVTSKLRPGPCP